MIGEWVLIAVTAVYAFLTYKIMIAMRETNEISRQSVALTKDMVLEIKRDRDLRFRPYIVPIDCKIDGTDSKDQFVICKNVGLGPALDCYILVLLFSDQEIQSMIIGMSSLSLAPGSEDKHFLVKLSHLTRLETLISFFPKECQEVIKPTVETGKLQSTLLELLGFLDQILLWWNQL